MAVGNVLFKIVIKIIEGGGKNLLIKTCSDDPANEVFMAIHAIESETDHFPIGPLRKQCADDYLQRVDDEMQRYLVETKEDILSACKNVIRVLS